MEKTEAKEIDYKGVCKELDILTNKYFETLELLLETRSKFSDTLKDGFIMMSKARYSMGAKSVGALQYSGNDLTAKYLVKEIDSGDEYHHLAVVDVQTLPSESKSESVVENIGAESSIGQLRKRTVGKLKEGAGDNLSDLPDISHLNMNGAEGKTSHGDESNHSPTENSQWKDPIKWFGVLVPQPLRQSQKDFQRAIEMSGDIVNLQKQLLTLKDDFHKMAAQKKLLKTEKIED